MGSNPAGRASKATGWLRPARFHSIFGPQLGHYGCSSPMLVSGLKRQHGVLLARRLAVRRQGNHFSTPFAAAYMVDVKFGDLTAKFMPLIDVTSAAEDLMLGARGRYIRHERPSEAAEIIRALPALLARPTLVGHAGSVHARMAVRRLRIAGRLTSFCSPCDQICSREQSGNRKRRSVGKYRVPRSTFYDSYASATRQRLHVRTLCEARRYTLRFTR